MALGDLILLQENATGTFGETKLQAAPYNAIVFNSVGEVESLPVVVPSSVDGGLFDLDEDLDTMPTNLNMGSDTRYELDANLDIMPKE